VLALGFDVVELRIRLSFSVVDEKYTDLPPRVSRLETTVFTSKQR